MENGWKDSSLPTYSSLSGRSNATQLLECLSVVNIVFQMMGAVLTVSGRMSARRIMRWLQP